MPTKPENRNYQREAAMESEARKEARRERKRARYYMEKKYGELPTNVHVDHIKPLSRGGGNSPNNLRLLKKEKNESFRRVGPGGKPRI
jgi:5-methylcytosine-specific restriction endonuclease McrA